MLTFFFSADTNCLVHGGNKNFAITNYGGGQNQVTDDLYNEYETGDIRRDTSFDLGYYKGGNWIAIKFQKKWKDLAAPVVKKPTGPRLCEVDVGGLKILRPCAK